MVEPLLEINDLAARCEAEAAKWSHQASIADGLREIAGKLRLLARYSPKDRSHA